ncbi:MAG: alkaline phosphatase family protein, partial [Planctomycetota bacterium]
MTNPTAVLNVVGLDRATLKHMPSLASLGAVTDLIPVLPAVTCSAQATMLTGLSPAQHGVVGNGWFERDQAEVRFWKQSNHLVQGEKVWETARRRDPSVTTAKLFWWFNMH